MWVRFGETGLEKPVSNHAKISTVGLNYVAGEIVETEVWEEGIMIRGNRREGKNTAEGMINFVLFTSVTAKMTGKVHVT
jgi:hypothetical protein